MEDNDQTSPTAALGELFRVASLEGATSLFMSFDEIGTLLGGLPQDAYVQKRWWTNSRLPHVKAWLDEGWVIDVVGFRLQRAAFKRR